MKVSFILVEPAVPENIGAAARAIKTMGFSDFRLIKPSNHLADEAKWLAHGSNDILENAKVFGDLKKCSEDLDFLIGTTAKNRSAKHDYYSPEKALQLTEDKGDSIGSVGIVFGREESGLTNAELTLCDIASTIPLPQPYPSLNLGQSVMLYAYVFSSIHSRDTKSTESEHADRLFFELKQSAKLILSQLDMGDDSVLRNRMMERLALVNADDARLMLSFVKKFRDKFE